MHKLATSRIEGIDGIMVMDSGIEGPILGISVCTHGGEVVGLDIIDSFLENVKLLNGKIIFILNNLEGYKKYLDLLSKGGGIVSGENLIQSRFIDENMNRCCSIENMNVSDSYEVTRAKELLPILQSLDVLLDIHSTYGPSDSMGILTEKSYMKFKDTFNVAELLLGITKIQVGRPFIDLVERHGGLGIGIESGCELDQDGYKTGLDNFLRLVISLKMINSKDRNIVPLLLFKKENKIIQVIDSILIKGVDFQFETTYKHLDLIKTGTTLCFDGENTIVADQECLMLMPSSNETNFKKLIGEEACFLGKIIH